MTNKTFDIIMDKIYRATTRTSWTFMDGDEEHHVFCSKNRHGQQWFYTAIFDDFGMAEKPCQEIIELTKPGELVFTFQAYRDENGVHISIHNDNLETKLERA